MRGGHECVVYDVNPDAVAALVAEGAIGATDYADLAAKLDGPRVVWLMIPPAGLTGRVVEEISEVLQPGDILIDGGNSNYRDDVRRAKALREKGLHYVDVGTSGGVFGLERGLLPHGGRAGRAFATITPILETIAPPGAGEIERTPPVAPASSRTRSSASCTAVPPAPATS